MAKQTFPGIKTGGGVLPKLIGFGVLLALLVIVVQYPAEAASWVKSAFSLAGDGIDGLVAFIRSIGG